jgi:hypothetical protein
VEFPFVEEAQSAPASTIQRFEELSPLVPEIQRLLKAAFSTDQGGLLTSKVLKGLLSFPSNSWEYDDSTSHRRSEADSSFTLKQR